MFKKVILITAALVFATGILTTSVYHASARTVTENPKSEALEFEVTGVEGEATQEVKEPVNYTLTYPGISSGHILYPLKMIRDRIWLFLTTDPLKKAELLLKLADKRIWEAQMLIDGGKIEIGVSKATKAEKYLGRAVDQEKIAREAGKETIFFLEKLAKASLKHEEILLDIREKTINSAKPVIDSCLEYARRAHKQTTEALIEQRLE